MLGWQYKQPAEKISVSVDFTNRMGTSETVSSQTVKAFDKAGTDVSTTLVDSSSSSGKVITAVIKAAGTDGENYDLQFQVTGSSGNIYEEDVVLAVRAETA